MVAVTRNDYDALMDQHFVGIPFQLSSCDTQGSVKDSRVA